MRGYLNITTWANRYGRPIKSNCLWKFGQYMVRGYLNITTWANWYGRPIKSNHFISLGLTETTAFGVNLQGQPIFTPLNGCSSSKVEWTDHHLWALSRWHISLNNTKSVQRIKHWSIKQFGSFRVVQICVCVCVCVDSTHL
jgi:hypothetical protein